MFGFVYLCVMKMNEIRYNDLSAYLAAQFPYKVQKISLNAGFTCPNRDGTVGYGGCTYCNNQTFNPAYCKTEKSVTEQLEEGKQFFARKYPEMKFLAYFQAYTNTYAELEELKERKTLHWQSVASDSEWECWVNGEDYLEITHWKMEDPDRKSVV